MEIIKRKIYLSRSMRNFKIKSDDIDINMKKTFISIVQQHLYWFMYLLKK